LEVIKNRLSQLEQSLGRAPPELAKWRLVITTDLSLTQGNVAACNIATKTVYIHSYFFQLSEVKQLEIFYHELYSHIAKGITEEDEAMKDTEEWIATSRENKGVSTIPSETAQELLQDNFYLAAIRRAIQRLTAIGSFEQLKAMSFFELAEAIGAIEIKDPYYADFTRDFIFALHNYSVTEQARVSFMAKHGLEGELTIEKLLATIPNLGYIHPEARNFPEHASIHPGITRPGIYYHRKNYERAVSIDRGYGDNRVTIIFHELLEEEILGQDLKDKIFGEYFVHAHPFVLLAEILFAAYAGPNYLDVSLRIIADQVFRVRWRLETHPYKVRIYRDFLDAMRDPVISSKFLGGITPSEVRDLNRSYESWNRKIDQQIAESPDFRKLYDDAEQGRQHVLCIVAAFEGVFDLAQDREEFIRKVTSTLFGGERTIFFDPILLPKAANSGMFRGGSLSQEEDSLVASTVLTSDELREWISAQLQAVDSLLDLGSLIIESTPIFESIRAVFKGHDSILIKISRRVREKIDALKDNRDAIIQAAGEYISGPDSEKFDGLTAITAETVMREFRSILGNEAQYLVYVLSNDERNGFFRENVIAKCLYNLIVLVQAWNLTRKSNTYPLFVPEAAKSGTEQRFGGNRILADIIEVEAFVLRLPKSLPGEIRGLLEVIKNRLSQLEQSLGRAPPELAKWRLVITTDLSLTQGNVAACNIATKTVYIHSYFFSISQEVLAKEHLTLKQLQLKILYHELISHIVKGLSDVDGEAMRDTNLYFAKSIFQSKEPSIRVFDILSMVKDAGKLRAVVSNSWLKFVGDALETLREEKETRSRQLGEEFDYTGDSNLLEEISQIESQSLTEVVLEQFKRWLQKFMRSPLGQTSGLAGGYVLVAYGDNQSRITGMAQIEVDNQDGRLVGTIRYIIVDPAKRHSGIGTMLLKKAVELFQEAGVDIIEVPIRRDNQESLSFHTKKLYVLLGIKPRIERELGNSNLILVVDLHSKKIEVILLARRFAVSPAVKDLTRTKDAEPLSEVGQALLTAQIAVKQEILVGAQKLNLDLKDLIQRLEAGSLPVLQKIVATIQIVRAPPQEFIMIEQEVGRELWGFNFEYKGINYIVLNPQLTDDPVFKAELAKTIVHELIAIVLRGTRPYEEIHRVALAAEKLVEDKIARSSDISAIIKYNERGIRLVFEEFDSVAFTSVKWEKVPAQELEEVFGTALMMYEGDGIWVIDGKQIRQTPLSDAESLVRKLGFVLVEFTLPEGKGFGLMVLFDPSYNVTCIVLGSKDLISIDNRYPWAFTHVYLDSRDESTRNFIEDVFGSCQQESVKKYGVIAAFNSFDKTIQLVGVFSIITTFGLQTSNKDDLSNWRIRELTLFSSRPEDLEKLQLGTDFRTVVDLHYFSDGIYDRQLGDKYMDALYNTYKNEVKVDFTPLDTYTSYAFEVSFEVKDERIGLEGTLRLRKLQISDHTFTDGNITEGQLRSLEQKAKSSSKEQLTFDHPAVQQIERFLEDQGLINLIPLFRLFVKKGVWMVGVDIAGGFVALSGKAYIQKGGYSYQGAYYSEEEIIFHEFLARLGQPHGVNKRLTCAFKENQPLPEPYKTVLAAITKLAKLEYLLDRKLDSVESIFDFDKFFKQGYLEVRLFGKLFVFTAREIILQNRTILNKARKAEFAQRFIKLVSRKGARENVSHGLGYHANFSIKLLSAEEQQINREAPFVPVDASEKGLSREEVGAYVNSRGGIFAIIREFGELQPEWVQQNHNVDTEIMHMLAARGVQFVRGPPQLGVANHVDAGKTYLIIPQNAHWTAVHHEIWAILNHAKAHSENPIRVIQIKDLLDRIDKEKEALGAGQLPHIIVISDYHGEIKAFLDFIADAISQRIGSSVVLNADAFPLTSIAQQLEAQGINIQESGITFYLLGDFLDRGEYGIRCFQAAKELIELGVARYITGNHDLWAFLNLMGLHLPVYQGYNFYGHSLSEELVALHWNDEDILANRILWWTAKLAEYNKAQSDLQKGILIIEGNEVAIGDIRARLKELYKQISSQLSDENKRLWEDLVGLYFGTDVATGFNGVGMMSTHWWQEHRERVRHKYDMALSQGALSSEIDIWQNLYAYVVAANNIVDQRLKQALEAGKWWWQVFNDMNSQNYASVEWWGKDWSSHKGWGTSVIDELNALAGEKVWSQGNYIASPILQDLALFYRQNFSLYLKDAYGNYYTHGWLPVDEKTGVVRFVYKGETYEGAYIWEGLDEIRADIRDLTKPLPELHEALDLVNSWYADKTTRIKPEYLKVYIGKVGLERVYTPLGIRVWFSCHNPLNKLHPLGIGFMSRQQDWLHFSVDKGMSWQKFEDLGGYVVVSAEGIKLRGYDDISFRRIVNNPPTIKLSTDESKNYSIKQRWENDSLSREDFLRIMMMQLLEELARCGGSNVQGVDENIDSVEECIVLRDDVIKAWVLNLIEYFEKTHIETGVELSHKKSLRDLVEESLKDERFLSIVKEVWETVSVFNEAEIIEVANGVWCELSDVRDWGIQSIKSDITLGQQGSIFGNIITPLNGQLQLAKVKPDRLGSNRESISRTLFRIVIVAMAWQLLHRVSPQRTSLVQEDNGLVAPTALEPAALREWIFAQLQDAQLLLDLGSSIIKSMSVSEFIQEAFQGSDSKFIEISQKVREKIDALGNVDAIIQAANQCLAASSDAKLHGVTDIAAEIVLGDFRSILGNEAQALFVILENEVETGFLRVDLIVKRLYNIIVLVQAWNLTHKSEKIDESTKDGPSFYADGKAVSSRGYVTRLRKADSKSLFNTFKWFIGLTALGCGVSLGISLFVTEFLFTFRLFAPGVFGLLLVVSLIIFGLSFWLGRVEKIISIRCEEPQNEVAVLAYDSFADKIFIDRKAIKEWVGFEEEGIRRFARRNLTDIMIGILMIEESLHYYNWHLGIRSRRADTIIARFGIILSLAAVIFVILINPFAMFFPLNILYEIIIGTFIITILKITGKYASQRLAGSWVFQSDRAAVESARTDLVSYIAQKPINSTLPFEQIWVDLRENFLSYGLRRYDAHLLLKEIIQDSMGMLSWNNHTKELRCLASIRPLREQQNTIRNWLGHKNNVQLDFATDLEFVDHSSCRLSWLIKSMRVERNRTSAFLADYAYSIGMLLGRVVLSSPLLNLETDSRVMPAIITVPLSSMPISSGLNRFLSSRVAKVKLGFVEVEEDGGDVNVQNVNLELKRDECIQPIYVDTMINHGSTLAAVIKHMNQLFAQQGIKTESPLIVVLVASRHGLIHLQRQLEKDKELENKKLKFLVVHLVEKETSIKAYDSDLGMRLTPEFRWPKQMVGEKVKINANTYIVQGGLFLSESGHLFKVKDDKGDSAVFVWAARRRKIEALKQAWDRAIQDGVSLPWIPKLFTADLEEAVMVLEYIEGRQIEKWLDELANSPLDQRMDAVRWLSSELVEMVIWFRARNLTLPSLAMSNLLISKKSRRLVATTFVEFDEAAAMESYLFSERLILRRALEIFSEREKSTILPLHLLQAALERPANLDDFHESVALSLQPKTEKRRIVEVSGWLQRWQDSQIKDTSYVIPLVLVRRFGDMEVNIRLQNPEEIKDKNAVVAWDIIDADDFLGLFWTLGALKQNDSRSKKIISGVRLSKGLPEVVSQEATAILLSVINSFVDELWIIQGDKNYTLQEWLARNELNQDGFVYLQDPYAQEEEQMRQDPLPKIEFVVSAQAYQNSLAERTSRELGVPLIVLGVGKTENDGWHMNIPEDVKVKISGKTILFIHTHGPRSNEEVIEGLFLLVALRRINAQVVFVSPYFRYARQDGLSKEKYNPGDGISAETHLRLTRRLTDRMIFFNLHLVKGPARQVRYRSPYLASGVPDVELININVMSAIGAHLIQQLEDLGSKKDSLALFAPDQGISAFVEAAAADNNLSSGSLRKRRISGDKVAIEGFSKRVNYFGRVILVLDDLTSTGGTLKEAANYLIGKLLHKKIWYLLHNLRAPRRLFMLLGLPYEFYVGVIHGVFAGGLEQAFKDSPINYHHVLMSESLYLWKPAGMLENQVVPLHQALVASLKEQGLINKGSPAECLRTMLKIKDDFPKATRKELEKFRGFKKTTVSIELAGLVGVGLVGIDNSNPAKPRYYLTDILSRAPPEIIDIICNLPELNRYKIPDEIIIPLKDKIKLILEQERFEALKPRDFSFYPPDQILEPLGPLSEEDILLDLGCGNGAVVIRAAQLGARAIGVDMNASTVNLARSKLEGWVGKEYKGNAEFKIALSQEIPLPDNSVTKITCIDIDTHMGKEDIVQTAREILRVLQLRGLIHVKSANLSPTDIKEKENILKLLSEVAVENGYRLSVCMKYYPQETYEDLSSMVYKLEHKPTHPDSDLMALSTQKGRELARVLREILEEVQFDSGNGLVRSRETSSDYYIEPLPRPAYFKALEEMKSMLNRFSMHEGQVEIITNRLRLAFRFFMFGESLTKVELEELFGQTRVGLIKEFIKFGLFVSAGDQKIRMNGLSLSSRQLRNGEVIYIFADTPAYFETMLAPERVYIGTDSYFLLERISDIPDISGYFVEIGSGSGIQLITALKLNQGITKAIGLEIDQRAINVSLFNAALNNVEDRIVIASSEGNLASELNENHVSIVVMNPPFIAMPEFVDLSSEYENIFSGITQVIRKDGLIQVDIRQLYGKAGWGGEDGIRVTREWLELLLPYMAKGGQIVIYSLFAGDAQGPTKITEYVRSKAGLSVRFEPLSLLTRFADSTSSTGSEIPGIVSSEDCAFAATAYLLQRNQVLKSGKNAIALISNKIMAEILASYEEQGISHFHTGHVLITIESLQQAHPSYSRLKDKEKDSDNGSILRGDKALAALVEGLRQSSFEDITNNEKLKQDISAIESRIGGRLRIGDNVSLRIIVKDAVVVAKDDFVLGFYSHAPPVRRKLIKLLGEEQFNRIFPTPTLVLTNQILNNPSSLIRQEYIYHEFICPILGHREAIAKQQAIYYENYLDGEYQEQDGVKYIKGKPKKIFKGLLGEAIRAEMEEQIVSNDRIQILIVDDDAAVCFTLGILLEEREYNIATVSDSRDALDKLLDDKGHFALIITDSTNAKELMGLLKIHSGKLPRIPVLLLTGMDRKPAENLRKELGIDYVFFKPFECNGLFRYIAGIILQEGSQVTTLSGSAEIRQMIVDLKDDDIQKRLDMLKVVIAQIGDRMVREALIREIPLWVVYLRDNNSWTRYVARTILNALHPYEDFLNAMTVKGLTSKQVCFSEGLEWPQFINFLGVWEAIEQLPIYEQLSFMSRFILRCETVRLLRKNPDGPLFSQARRFTIHLARLERLKMVSAGVPLRLRLRVSTFDYNSKEELMQLTSLLAKAGVVKKVSTILPKRAALDIRRVLNQPNFDYLIEFEPILQPIFIRFALNIGPVFEMWGLRDIEIGLLEEENSPNSQLYQSHITQNIGEALNFYTRNISLEGLDWSYGVLVRLAFVLGMAFEALAILDPEQAQSIKRIRGNIEKGKGVSELLVIDTIFNRYLVAETFKELQEAVDALVGLAFSQDEFLSTDTLYILDTINPEYSESILQEKKRQGKLLGVLQADLSVGLPDGLKERVLQYCHANTIELAERRYRDLKRELTRVVFSINEADVKFLDVAFDMLDILSPVEAYTMREALNKNKSGEQVEPQEPLLGFFSNLNKQQIRELLMAIAAGIMVFKPRDIFKHLNIRYKEKQVKFHEVIFDSRLPPITRLPEVFVFADSMGNIYFSSKAKELFISTFPDEQGLKIALQALVRHEDAESHGKTHLEAIEEQRQIEGYEQVKIKLESLQEEVISEEIKAYVLDFKYVNPGTRGDVRYALSEDTLPKIFSLIQEVTAGQKANYQRRIDARVVKNIAVLAKLALVWEHSPIMMGANTEEKQKGIIRALIIKYATDDEASRFVEENLGEEAYGRIMHDTVIFAQVNLIYDYYHNDKQCLIMIRRFLVGHYRPNFVKIKRFLRRNAYYMAGWSAFFDNKSFNPNCIGDSATFSPISYIKYAFREGLANVELAVDFLPFDPDKRLPGEIDYEERQRIKALAQTYGVALTVHSPLVGPQHPKTGFKQLFEEPLDNLGLIEETIELSEDLGARVLVVHLVNKVNPLIYAEIAKQTKGRNLRIGFENYADKAKRFPTIQEHFSAFRDIVLALNEDCPEAVRSASLLLDGAHLNLVSNLQDPLMAAITVMRFAENLAGELRLFGDKRKEFIRGLVSELHLNQNIGPIRFFNERKFFSADLHTDIEQTGTIANDIFITILFHQGFRPFVVAEQVNPVTVGGRLFIDRASTILSRRSYRETVEIGRIALDDWNKKNTAEYASVRAILEDEVVREAYQYFVGHSGIENLLAHLERRRMHFMLSLYYFNGPLQEHRFGLNIKPRTKEYRSGEAVVIQGEPGNIFFIIIKGKAKVLKAFPRQIAEGGIEIKEEEVAALGEGEFFGEMAILDPFALRQATVVATEALEVIELPANEFWELSYRLPEFERFVQATAQNRNQANETYRENFRQLDFKGKLEWLLSKLQVSQEEHESLYMQTIQMIGSRSAEEEFSLQMQDNNGSLLPVLIAAVFKNSKITVMDKDPKSFRLLQKQYRFIKNLLNDDMGNIEFRRMANTVIGESNSEGAPRAGIPDFSNKAEGFFDNLGFKDNSAIEAVIERKGCEPINHGTEGFINKLQNKRVRFYVLTTQPENTPGLFVYARIKEDILEIYLSIGTYRLFAAIFTPDQLPIVFSAIARHEYAEEEGNPHKEAIMMQGKIRGYNSVMDKLELLQVIVRIGYTEEAIPAIVDEFQILFSEINFTRFRARFQSAKNTEQLRKTLRRLLASVWLKGYTNVNSPRNLVCLLTNMLPEVDIFKLINEYLFLGENSLETKESLKEEIVSCTAISQLVYILLVMLRLDVKGVIVPDHAFTLITLDNQRVLFADFSLNVIREIDLSDYYEREGDYLVLKPGYRISAERIIEIQKEVKENRLDPDSLTDRELLHTYYFYLHIMDSYGLTPSVYNNIGATYIKLGRVSDAVGILEKALSMDDAFAETYFHIGIAWFKLGNFGAARQAYQRTSTANPILFDPYFNLGELLSNSGDHIGAIEAYEKATVLRPDYAELYFRIGLVYIAMGKTEEAVAIFSKAIALEPGLLVLLPLGLKDSVRLILAKAESVSEVTISTSTRVGDELEVTEAVFGRLRSTLEISSWLASLPKRTSWLREGAFGNIDEQHFRKMIQVLFGSANINSEEKREIDKFSGLLNRELVDIKDAYRAEGTVGTCYIWAPKVTNLMRTAGFLAITADLERSTTVYYNEDIAIPGFDTFTLCRIAGHWFILTITADQFVPKNPRLFANRWAEDFDFGLKLENYHDVGIVLLPIEMFWYMSHRKRIAKLWMFSIG
ncbi:MAG: GNAT family N-acetyltransferase, partial [Candidatus Omnitrophota bacterium]|nr:GNAT family N-acetyltransferase [Candidatus Omnitrophota bacterium]